ncbi:hypothetical protein GLYMA_15G029051v4 [Glycine max]|nr:hypothetical protein GLYMA_15G029051v4 [Glycine max]KAH1145255.1 hypothetical protein GYH30_041166 [Glycine max]
MFAINFNLRCCSVFFFFFFFERWLRARGIESPCDCLQIVLL